MVHRRFCGSLLALLVVGLSLASCTTGADGEEAGFGTQGSMAAAAGASTTGAAASGNMTAGGIAASGGMTAGTTTAGATSAGMTTASTTGGGMTTASTTGGGMTTASTTGGGMTTASTTTAGTGAAANGAGGAASGGTGLGGISSGGANGSGGSGGAFDGQELFILIGQSNMSGMSPMPSEPWPINDRVSFMVQFDCDDPPQTAVEWLPAEPPLHGCQWATGGIGLGLADFFGAKLAEQWPDSKIGLIPNAFPGQPISIYLKEGGTEAPVPPEYANAYEMTVDRSRKAQQQGRIRAILMHQGESDDNRMISDQWLGRVATVISDLRADLNLGEEVPLLVGQIGPSQWEKHNAYVDQVPDYVPNSAVISAEGTDIHDVAHFDEASAQIMGERYVEKFLELVPRP